MIQVKEYVGRFPLSYFMRGERLEVFNTVTANLFHVVHRVTGFIRSVIDRSAGHIS